MMNESINYGFLSPLRNAWFDFFVGVAFIIAGLFAVHYAVFTTLFSVAFLGGLFVIGGIAELLRAFGDRTWGRFALHSLVGILYALAGGFMLYNPAENAVTLTLLFALLFIITGVARIFFALSYKLPNWGWVLFGGILNIILGVLIWQQWPDSGLWVIGAFVGIDLIFSGFSLVFLSFFVHRIKNLMQNRFSK